MSKPVVQFKPKADAPAPQLPGKKTRKRTFLTLARASVIVAGIGLAVVVAGAAGLAFAQQRTKDRKRP